MENSLFVCEISYPGENLQEKENFCYSLRRATVSNQICIFRPSHTCVSCVTDTTYVTDTTNAIH